MKRTNVFGGIIILLMAVFTLSSCGKKAAPVKNSYSRADELNEKIATYTTDGWKIHGSTRTLRGKLQEHYEKIEANPNLQERIGTSTNCTSVTVCRLSALNSACIQYATEASNQVKGAVMRDMQLDESKAEEFNRFYAAYKNGVNAKIQGELQESIALIRSENGKNSYEIYYLLDKEAARNKRQEALQEAMNESKIAQDYAKQISKFVEEEVSE